MSLQLGHKVLGITEVDTEYSPAHLLEAWAAVCETIAKQQAVAELA